jgi:uncharacterized protein YdeI (YjbR/CyaY-like superfamily)
LSAIGRPAVACSVCAESGWLQPRTEPAISPRENEVIARFLARLVVRGQLHAVGEKGRPHLLLFIASRARLALRDDIVSLRFGPRRGTDDIGRSGASTTTKRMNRRAIAIPPCDEGECSAERRFCRTPITLTPRHGHNVVQAIACLAPSARVVATTVSGSEMSFRLLGEGGACMEMAYRARWEAEIAEMRRVLGGLGMQEECKWGKPTYTVDGKNIVIMQGFKDYFGLGFFQGALLKDPEKVLVQLGQVHAGRVMKFTSAKDIAARAATIKAYVREAIAVEHAGLRMKPKKTSDLSVPDELKERFRRDPRFKRAFEALTPGRQRSYLYHFAAAKQSATRVARIERAMPAIFEGRGFLERRK